MQMASDKAHLLASCFSILESAIVFLYTNLASKADEKLALKFYSAVNDAFLSVVSYMATFLLPEKQHRVSSSSLYKTEAQKNLLFIYSFIWDIYIVPPQEIYSEAHTLNYVCSLRNLENTKNRQTFKKSIEYNQSSSAP